MKFCVECEKPLQFHEFLDGELCTDCATSAKIPKKKENEENLDPDDLAELYLAQKNGKIVLQSKEGWTLWSSSGPEPAQLGNVLARARRILAIRRKTRTKG